MRIVISFPCGGETLVGTLDANQGALKNQTFTLVGYGVDIGDITTLPQGLSDHLPILITAELTRR